MKRAAIGTDCRIEDGATVGHAYDRFGQPAVIGDNATIRRGTIIYASAELGESVTTGHNALVREQSNIGDHVVIGTGVTIDGNCRIGSDTSLQTGAYVPTETEIGDSVFLGPNAVLTNDAYPVRERNGLEGPTIEDHVTIGANATILPGVNIGAGSFVAAGAVVTEDVPPDTLAVGVPANHGDLPPRLAGENLLP